MEGVELVNIAAAGIGGLAVGIEREWSGHASGSRPHFAGLRTFTLLGMLAGLAGHLWSRGDVWPALALLAAGAGLVIAAYVAASRHDVDGTTEVAALVVLAAGFLAGGGGLALASGVVAITVLILVEKSRLHGFAERINDAEMRAATRFAVMAVVILPLLPEGPYGPYGGIRPRALWALVLLFSGISFAGYIGRRAVGERHGYPLAGLLGGLVSSTQVTLAYARLSDGPPGRQLSLACGALAASTVLFLRTLVACAVLEHRLALAAMPYLGAGFLAGLFGSVLMLRRSPAVSAPSALGNPLQLRSAISMAALFQLVLIAVELARTWFGSLGLFGSAALAGLTDADAVTVSMARVVGDGVAAELAARALAIGIISNTLLKLGLAAVLGRGRFRVAVVAGLGAIVLAVGAVIVLFALGGNSPIGNPGAPVDAGEM